MESEEKILEKLDELIEIQDLERQKFLILIRGMKTIMDDQKRCLREYSKHIKSLTVSSSKG
jgi:hypothetical protein